MLEFSLYRPPRCLPTIPNLNGECHRLLKRNKIRCFQIGSWYPFFHRLSRIERRWLGDPGSTRFTAQLIGEKVQWLVNDLVLQESRLNKFQEELQVEEGMRRIDKVMKGSFCFQVLWELFPLLTHKGRKDRNPLENVKNHQEPLNHFTLKTPAHVCHASASQPWPPLPVGGWGQFLAPKYLL